MSDADLANVGAGALRARLESRARALAARPEADAPGEDTHGAIQSMVFRRGSERFALPLVDVVEISRHARVTPLAGAAAPVIGLAGWRGRVLTVIDLNPGADSDGDHLIVAGSGRAAFAILADELEAARPLVADPAASAEARRAAYASGVTTDAITIVDYKLLQHSLT
jgi:chemotaxis signal transduction protein